MTQETARKMLLSGAIFNWAIAITLFFVPEFFLGLLAISPTPDQSVWVQLFAGLVFTFGIGYYWASRDFEANIQIVRMAVIGKAGVVLIALLNISNGDISWQFMIPASGDLIYTILFVMALRALPTWRSGGVV